MSEPLTKPCASDLEGLWINFLANIVQVEAQATGSSHCHIMLQKSVNNILNHCLSYKGKKAQDSTSQDEWYTSEICQYKKYLWISKKKKIVLTISLLKI